MAGVEDEVVWEEEQREEVEEGIVLLGQFPLFLKKKIPNFSFLLEYNPPPKILHPIFYSSPIKKIALF